MLVAQVMNSDARRVLEGTSLREAVEHLVASQVSDLAVVDSRDHLVGILSEGDVLCVLIPDLNEVVSAGGSLNDVCRFFLENGPQLAEQKIDPLIIRNPISVAPDDPLLKVATVMVDRMLRRVPVVDGGLFVGSISRADLAWALIRGDDEGDKRAI